MCGTLLKLGIAAMLTVLYFVQELRDKDVEGKLDPSKKDQDHSEL